MRDRRIIQKSALCLLLLTTLATGYAAHAAQNDAEPVQDEEIFQTTDDDIEFVERFQQAIREDDRQWIIDHTKIGFGLIIRGKSSDMNSKKEIARRFDEIYTPAVREAILATPLHHLRKSWRDLLFLRSSDDSPLITIAISCAARPVGCQELTYEINSVTR